MLKGEDIKNNIINAIRENRDEDNKAYVQKIKDRLQESLGKYEKIKIDVKKQSVDSKNYKKMCNKFERALQISEVAQTTGVDEILSCIYEMKKNSFENQILEEKFREKEKIVKEFLKKNSTDIEMVDVEKENYLIQQLKDLISLSEEVMELIKVNDSFEKEDELLDKKLETMKIRMKLLEEDEKTLEKLEGLVNCSEADFSNIDFLSQYNNTNESRITNNKLCELIEKLHSKMIKNIELDNETKIITKEIEKLDNLSNQLEYLRKLSEIDFTEIKNFDPTELLKNFPSLAEEIIKFKEFKNKVDEKKLSYQKRLEEFESLYSQKMKEFDKLNTEKKDIIETINELNGEVDNLREQCGDKAYMLDDMVLDKIRKESLMLEECLNMTKQIEDEQEEK
uniref:Reticulocyte binding protein n=1 Tax=Strongyloides stercoralis TaxID=6248 RepID=A0A0K0EHR0_STRER